MVSFYKSFSLIAFLSLLSFTTYSQSKPGSVAGKIVNAKDFLPIDFASVAIKNMSDSSVAGVTNSMPDGSFEIKGLAPGSYRLSVAYLGLKPYNKLFAITVASPAVRLADIPMEETGLTLKTVEIKGAVVPVVVKEDTVEYNAAAFKVRENAVVEDVLKKLPGVEVAKDGSIKAQGETVTRVRVDGKDFFGDDPLLATKNLPANMIDKIQVIDLLSEQSQFTGVDDGNREKIINITTKAGMKKGYFGNSTAGYGTDDTYDVNLNLNRFKDNQQMSVIGQINNVNKQSFGSGRGGGTRGGGGRSGSNSNAPQQGITTTNALGLNFADEYASGTKVTASYFFNKTSLFNEQSSFRQNLLGNQTTTFNEDERSTSDNTNHRFSFMLDTKIDSSTTIRVEPNISYTKTNSISNSKYVNNYVNNVTDGIQKYTADGSTPTISNNILLRKKFLRRGRTLSFNVRTNVNNSNADNYNYILNHTTDSAGLVTQDLTDQLNDVTSRSIGNTARVVYTEPLSKEINLETNYENGYSFSKRERYAFDYNTTTSKYDIPDFNYSNAYENTTLTNSIGTSINKNTKLYNWGIGIAVQHTDRKNDNLTTGEVLKQSFFNFTPTAQLRYKFSKSKRLIFRYRGSTQQPSINQIQPIADNTNTQTISMGNPDLKPAFSNSLNILYNNFNFEKFRSLFVFANLSQTFNAFGNTTNTIESGENQGKLAVVPINVDGVYQASLGSSIGLPVIKDNKLNLNIDLNGSYARGVNFTNSIDNITNDFSVTNRYRLVTSLDKLDLSAGIGGSINRATYSAQPAQNTTYYTLNPTIDVSYMFPGEIRLAVDANYYQNTGRGEAYDINYTIMNGYMSKQFFNNKGTFKLSVNDILNQSQGIARTSSNNTITDLRYNVLKRYFMFSFTYSLTAMGGKGSGGDRSEGRSGGGPGGRGMGGGPGRM